MEIIELLFLLVSISLSLVLRDPSAHNRGREDRKSLASVQMIQAGEHVSAQHMHTPCFVSATTGTVCIYIMRLSGLHCSQFILPVQQAGVRQTQSNISHPHSDSELNAGAISFGCKFM